MAKNFSQLLEEIAKQYGVSIFEVKAEMEKAIDEAWNNADETARAEQRKLFPNGKPTIEEFIVEMAKKVQDEQDL